MKDVRPIRGKFFLERAIAEGEHETQDFKYAISDARKIARSLSAFANHRGGRLLIGVKDNGVIAGVRNEEDIYVVEQAAQMYCRPEQKLEFKAFRGCEGNVVICAEIARSPVRPVMACDTDGEWKAYRRVADENILATPMMVKAWRSQGSDASLSVGGGTAEAALVDLIDADGWTDAGRLAVRCRISMRRAEEAICRAYGMGLVDFGFVGRRFVIVRGVGQPLDG